VNIRIPAGVLLGLVWVAGLTPCSVVEAHEVPTDVVVRVFVHPEGRQLRLLVRVPLEAMQDYQFPQRGPGYLDLERATPVLQDAAARWISSSISLYEGGSRLQAATTAALRVSLPSNRSFGSYEGALGHVTGDPLPPETQLPWQQAMFDVLFEYPIQSESSEFSIDPQLARLSQRTTTVLVFVTPGGGERAFQYIGNPGLVRLDPRWHQAALRFVELGFWHILDGIDHLLFLLCLVIPFRRLWPLVPIVTSFTVAHSITLIASAVGLAPNALWFPPLIETLIALSIVYMALENIVGPRLQRRWLIAFGFGLVHGFGFSFVLRETLQFAGSHLLTSLLAFNAGVEIGQLFVLALIIPLLGVFFRRVVAKRAGTILLSALVAHSAWHWMSERASDLGRYQLRWPALDVALVTEAARWLGLLAVLAAAVWLLSWVFGRMVTAAPEGEMTADD